MVIARFGIERQPRDERDGVGKRRKRELADERVSFQFPAVVVTKPTDDFFV
jgi:hypothetical protein